MDSPRHQPPRPSAAAGTAAVDAAAGTAAADTAADTTADAALVLLLLLLVVRHRGAAHLLWNLPVAVALRVDIVRLSSLLALCRRVHVPSRRELESRHHSPTWPKGCRAHYNSCDTTCRVCERGQRRAR